MKNILYFDNNFDCDLLVNEEKEGNTIWVDVDTDGAANQVLEILVNGATTTINLVPNSDNLVQIVEDYWNFGSVTSIRLSKTGFVSDYIELSFPDSIDSDSSLYETSDRHYSMQGSFNVQDAVEDLQGEVQDISLRVLDYLLPYYKNLSTIADGGSSNIMQFEFHTTSETNKISFESCIGMVVATTVIVISHGEYEYTYQVCKVNVTFFLDGSQVVRISESFGDGSHVMSLNFYMSDLTVGNHQFIIRLALAGGSIS